MLGVEEHIGHIHNEDGVRIPLNLYMLSNS